MNRIENLFQIKKKKILSVYFTAGYPELDNTIPIIKELARSGVDMIEIGMPFSDPVADGPVIQRSSERALANGMSLKVLFRQLESVRAITDIPLILMGYINPVFRFGVENFIHKCRDTGIDGTIIPDLPVDEYINSYEPLFRMNNILNIFLISPQTTDERIIYLDSISRGFLYLISSAATTGATSVFDEIQIKQFKKLNELNLRTPRLIGFGISDKATFRQACDYSDGAIIGSAFIRSLDGKVSLPEAVKEFVGQIKG